MQKTILLLVLFAFSGSRAGAQVSAPTCPIGQYYSCNIFNYTMKQISILLVLLLSACQQHNAPLQDANKEKNTALEQQARCILTHFNGRYMNRTDRATKQKINIDILDLRCFVVGEPDSISNKKGISFYFGYYYPNTRRKVSFIEGGCYGVFFEETSLYPILLGEENNFILLSEESTKLLLEHCPMRNIK